MDKHQMVRSLTRLHSSILLYNKTKLMLLNNDPLYCEIIRPLKKIMDTKIYTIIHGNIIEESKIIILKNQDKENIYKSAKLI